MIVRVDGRAFPIEALWWPTMNFGQFRWEGRVAKYEIQLPRTDLVLRLGEAYEECVRELRADDAVDPADASRLMSLGYPPLDRALDDATGRREVVRYLWDRLLDAYLMQSRPPTAWFMVNSIDDALATAATVTIRGRGFHGGGGGSGLAAM